MILDIEMKKSGKRVIEYDVLRVVATILVVLGHCSYLAIRTNFGGINYLFEYSSVGGLALFSRKALSILIEAIYSFHMPLFC